MSAEDPPVTAPGRETPGGAGVASRRAALQAVRRVHEQDAWAGPAVRTALDRSRLDERDRSFAANLAYEALRWEGTLDWALSHASTRPLERVEPALLDVLRLGAWELLHGSTPDRAAVATAVELTRETVGNRATGFVNGVLRGLARRRSELPYPPEDTDEGLGLRLGYPGWVVRETRARFGTRARAVLEAGNRPPGLTLRATDRAALLAELRAAGLDPRPGEHAPEAVRLPGADPARLPAVAEGRAVPQDEASMVVVHAVGAAPGRTVLDACAGPGGKSTHLNALGARVLAGDLHPGRARQIAESAARLGLAGVHVVQADATRPAWPEETFDGVLVDAPCTGLGVARRRPELRWRRAPDDPARLARLQLALLEAQAAAVKPGGRLVYSACTWPRSETVEVARAFLAAHGDRFVAEDALLKGGVAGTDDDGGRQLAPDVEGTDGMYLAAFTRFG